MSAPLPLSGSNPYTAGYQQRQFGVGSILTPAPTTPISVFDSMANPPATGTTAEAETALTLEAKFFGFTTQTITVNGGPNGGNFVLGYYGNPTSVLNYNATAANVQTALRALGGEVANVTVSGNQGGPWTVTGFASGVPLQLIAVRQYNLTGGTEPTVTVTTTGQQQGIVPF